MTLMESIARMEGFFAPTSNWSQINNNPGNLRASSLAVGNNGGFAVFQSVEDGWKALGDLLNHYADQGLTIKELFYKYAPPSDNNNTDAYIAYVAGQLNVSPDTPVASVLGDVNGTGTTLDVNNGGTGPNTDYYSVGIGIVLLFGAMIFLKKVMS